MLLSQTKSLISHFHNELIAGSAGITLLSIPSLSYATEILELGTKGVLFIVALIALVRSFNKYKKEKNA